MKQTTTRFHQNAQLAAERLKVSIMEVSSALSLRYRRNWAWEMALCYVATRRDQRAGKRRVSPVSFCMLSRAQVVKRKTAFDIFTDPMTLFVTTPLRERKRHYFYLQASPTLSIESTSLCSLEIASLSRHTWLY